MCTSFRHRDHNFRFHKVLLRIMSPEIIQAPPLSLQRPIAELFFEINRLLPFMMNLVDEFRKRRNRRGLDDASQTMGEIFFILKTLLNIEYIRVIQVLFY